MKRFLKALLGAGERKPETPSTATFCVTGEGFALSFETVEETEAACKALDAVGVPYGWSAVRDGTPARTR